MYAKKLAFFLQKRLKIFIVLLALIFSFGLVHSNTVHADDAKSLQDVAQHYAEAGQYWSTSDKPSDQRQIKGVGQNWNYFGPGSKSILTSSQKGMNVATYNALQHSDPNSNNFVGSRSSLNVAARFAYAMSQAGLDHPNSGGINLMSGIGRHITGWTVAIILWAMWAAQWVMSVVFKLFKWANPFYVLQYFVLSTPDNALQKSFFAPLLTFLKPLYKAISGMSISIAAFSLAIGIMLVLMGFVKQGSNYSLGGNLGAKFFKYLLRLMIIFGGPILIGLMAAAMTDEMEKGNDITSNIGVRQVYSNYINFGDWAQNTRLALPEAKDARNQLNINGSNAFDSSYIYKINTQAADNKTAKLGSSEDVSKHHKFNKATGSTVSKVAGWLTGDYAGNASINGSDWESFFRTQLLSQAKSKGLLKDDDTKKNPYKLISSDKFGDYGNAQGFADAIKLVFYSDYSLNSKAGKNGTPVYYNTTPVNGKVAPGTASGAGLSSIGIYNYLNVYATGSGLQYTKPSTFMGLGSVNQHASAGLVGRGILSIGTWLRMLVLMATAALIVWFVTMIVLEGVLKGIPNILKYSLQLASGSPTGFMGVFREFVGMYSRIIIGQLIVWLFQGSLESISNQIDDLIEDHLNGSTMINLANLRVNTMPFMMNSNLMGIIRIMESAGIGLAIFVMLKSYRDVLRFIDKCIERIMDLIRKTGPGRHMMPMPKANAAGMNSNSNMANNANSSALSKDSSNKDDSLPDLWGNDGSKDPEKQMGMSNKDIHGHQAAKMGEDIMRGLAKSPLGHSLGKAAVMAGGVLGGSKLGRKMGLKGRGEGMMAVQHAMKKMAQAQHMRAHPKTADNSARAGMAEGQKRNADAQEQHRIQDKTNEVASKFQKDRSAKQNLLNKFDSKGRLKKGEDASQVMEDMANKGYGSEDLKKSMKQYQDATNNSVKARGKHQQAINNALAKSKDKIAQDKEKLAAAKTPQQKELAKKQLAYDQKQAKKLQNMADKANFASDPVKKAMFEKGNKKRVGMHGEGARKASAKDMATAQNRQFTAMTGKSASSATKASEARMKQAAKAKKAAQDVLNDKHSTAEQRDMARQTMHDANVVLSTGKEFGQFSSQSATDNLQDATSAEKAQASKMNDIDQATISTGFVATEDAESISAPEAAYANKVASAQQVLDTGQVQDEQGQMVAATPEQMQTARNTLAASPSHEIRAIRNEMATTATSVLADANDYAETQVAKAPDKAPPAQLNTLRTNAINQYMQRPEVMKQLQSTGLVMNTSGAPSAMTHQVQEVSRLGQTSSAAIRASFAGLRQDVNGGMSSSQDAIKQASYEEYDKLPASNRWVDSMHYVDGAGSTTTNREVSDNVNNLLRAYGTGDRQEIIKAREQAAKIGMSNPLINSQQELQKVAQKMQSERDNMVNVALNHSTAPITESLESLHNDFDTMRGTATATADS